KSVAPKLKEMVRKSDDHRHGLRALWALNNIGAFDENFGREMLGHANSWVRAWAVRLLGQMDRNLNEKTWERLGELAKDKSPDVRLQLAASCQRWNQLPKPKDRKSRCIGIVLTLLFHDEDFKDPVLPIMDWVALEPSAAATYRDTSEGILDRVEM